MSERSRPQRRQRQRLMDGMRRFVMGLPTPALPHMIDFPIEDHAAVVSQRCPTGAGAAGSPLLVARYCRRLMRREITRRKR